MSLKKIIENINLDKLRHLALGVVYSSLIIVGGVFGDYFAFLGFIIGIFLAAWKEIWHDWRLKKGNPECADFIYNTIPIVIVFIAYLM